ncbi:MAG: hypothetical protein MI743_09425 [Sneathiellales bacterium]|nr:hypothetical protein [Sneathiellales bacterium]
MAAMSPTAAWIFLFVFWIAPLGHVLLSRRAGPWLPPADSRCPFGPRVGWLVIVLLLGLIGWLMFWSARYRRRPAGE